MLRIGLIALSLWIALAAAVRAEIWDAPRALAAVEAGEMVMLDIRTPDEWKKTGVAKGAWPIDLYDPKFGAELQKVLDGNTDKRIGLICATGGRTAYVVSALERNGITGVIDVNEGMFGSGHGPGWLKRGLPLVTAQTALDAIPGDYRAD